MNVLYIYCRVERRTKTLQKSVKFTRAESTTEKDKDRVCLYGNIYFICTSKEVCIAQYSATPDVIMFCHTHLYVYIQV